MRVDRRYFLAYVGGTALGVLAFDNFGNIKTVAAPLQGGTLNVASVP
jgi:hypothetical protein